MRAGEMTRKDARSKWKSNLGASLEAQAVAGKGGFAETGAAAARASHRHIHARGHGRDIGDLAMWRKQIKVGLLRGMKMG